jgi:molecular chaperone DnaK
MIEKLIDKTAVCMHKALRDAFLSPRNLNKVMLVGGATRTPFIHQTLKERLEIEPRFEIDPDLIVAMGAAVQGGVLAGEKRHAILVDITPHTLSTAALSLELDFPKLVCVPIIPRNSPLPARKSEMFHTISDGQEKVEVTAYQGESAFPEENMLIGKFFIEGLADVPAGNPVTLNFDLDLNGMLTATSTEKATGLSKTVSMDTRGKSGLDVAAARKNIAALVGEENSGQGPDEDFESLLDSAKDLRKRAETLLARPINDGDAAEIRRLMQESAAAIGSRQFDELARVIDALSDLLFYLED